VGGDRVEVNPEAVQLHFLVRRRLTAVEQDERSAVVGPLGDLPDRKRTAVEIRGMEQAHQPNPPGQPFFEGLRIEPTVIGERQDLDPNPPLGDEPLPDDEVGVVFPI